MRISLQALLRFVPFAALSVLVSCGATSYAILPQAFVPTTMPVGVTDLRVIGNSITWHGADASIGWSGNWGMAASSEANDFAHLVATAFKLPVSVINITSLEREPSSAAAQTALAAAGIKAGTAVVVELGDNVSNVSAFRTSYAALLDSVATGKSLTCTSTWWYNSAVNDVIRAACAAHNGKYADISAIYRDPRNTDRATNTFRNSFVAAHPHDWGMAQIALFVEDSMVAE